MPKLDDSSGALSAAVVAKETLKDRVTQLHGKVDHLGGQVTMATMYLSGDAKLWWRTRYEDVLEDRCEINAWEEQNRKLKERKGAVPA